MNNISIIREPFILVLIGLPASGKSAWTREFMEKYGDRFDCEVAYISLDKYIDARAAEKGNTYSEEYANSVGYASAMLKSESNDAFRNGLNIVWDQTNLSKKKKNRAGILKKVPDGYQKIAVDFDVPDKVLTERLERRAREEGKFIPKHVIESMCKSYVPVTKSEGFEIIEKVR